MNDIHFVDARTREIAGRSLMCVGFTVCLAAIVFGWRSLMPIPDVTLYAAESQLPQDKPAKVRVNHVTRPTSQSEQPKKPPKSEPEPALQANTDVATETAQQSKEAAAPASPPEKISETSAAAEVAQTAGGAGDTGSPRGETASRYEFESMDSYYTLARESGAVFAAIDPRARLCWKIGKSLEDVPPPQPLNASDLTAYSRRQAPLPQHQPEVAQALNQLRQYGLTDCDIVLLIPTEIDSAILAAQKSYLQIARPSFSDQLITKVRVTRSLFGQTSFEVINAYSSTP